MTVPPEMTQEVARAVRFMLGPDAQVQTGTAASWVADVCAAESGVGFELARVEHRIEVHWVDVQSPRHQRQLARLRLHSRLRSGRPLPFGLDHAGCET